MILQFEHQKADALGASVLILAHLDSPFLSEALESVAKQVTDLKFEILVALDRPTKKLINQIDDFKLNFPSITITIFDLSSLGIAMRLNFLASKSRFGFLFILDSDDRMIPNRINAQANYLLANPKCAVIGSSLAIIDHMGNKIGEKGFFTNADYISLNKYKRLPVAHPAVAIRKESFCYVGGYRDFYWPSEDYDLWLRILDKFEISNTSEILTEYRVHPSQVTASKFFHKHASAIAAKVSSRKRNQGKMEINDVHENPARWARRSPFFPYIILLSSRSAVWHRARKALLGKNYLNVFFNLVIFMILSPISGRREIWNKLNKRIWH